ncbi:MAG: hypothetical protein ACI3ZR_08915 [bacterium]
MKINLTANTEQTVPLNEAKLIQVTNNSTVPVYAKNNGTVTTEADKDTYTIPPESTVKLDFGYNNCSSLHLISPQDAEISIVPISKFKGIHRGTLSPNTEAEVDFKETPAYFIVQNLSQEGILYFAMNGHAAVGGSGSIKVPPLVEINNIKGCKTVSLISDSETEYQVIGVI